ncbi:MAG: bifunctional riboflavin kinase/FAD synthetase [Proteobacteria bacterium]|nr:bifunctional riboflavin kinase/FAD synthetase [Pseudomonadota bacterium]
MKIFSSSTCLPQDAAGAVIAIGNFDGVHRGHRELLARARALADMKQRRLGILTFEPHPRALFRPDDPPFRITPAAMKARKLAECGADILFSLPFDWAFASQSPELFIENVLKEKISPSHIVIGNDFAFGQLRKGTPETLKKAGFAVTVLEMLADEGEDKYSSSGIRQSLQEGDIEAANEALGWEWEIEGAVVKGDQRGRTIGYPTANVPLGDTVHPAYGVYATWTQIEGETQWRASATNIGIRPMFELKTGQVETYIFNFDRDIYGKTLRVKPVRRLRGEAKFESLDALVNQIKKDCEEALRILSA